MPSDRLDSFYRQTPLVLAHRGASFDAPENTLAAFLRAREQGADGIELDTMLSADGVPVVIHDFTLDTTTDGHGLVREYNLKMLKTLDAGSHYDHEFKGEPIPTLDEALETIGRGMVINVELKSMSWRDDGLPAAVFNVLRRHANKAVIVSSFNPFALRRFRALAPDIPTGFLYSPDEPPYIRLLMHLIPHDARHPHFSLVTPQFMEWARARRLRVHVWTVDDPARIQTLRTLGVDAIITNRPALALETLGRVSAQKKQDN
ncbi:MAG: glycerophosphodiester phosphodiesterase [Anaerolinea sp.]|nr:glycerophosphodiester phosphodiesterase [Anaerolinea sp.]MCC6976165.1 glycerophosphodiester phosphodiesterase [Anaerolineae bacterium]CAG0984822.1 glycerophosphoryl diester phosphodiesterase [Anaerolineae bacterium]